MRSGQGCNGTGGLDGVAMASEGDGEEVVIGRRRMQWQPGAIRRGGRMSDDMERCTGHVALFYYM